MNKVEGVYTYFCSSCETLFAVVARFTVKNDFISSPKCPKCHAVSKPHGEGFINYKIYSKPQEVVNFKEDKKELFEDSYPMLLTSNEVAKILGVSKRVAYEVMERKDFPLIRIRRLKRVNRDSFFEWLNQHKESNLEK